MSWYVVLFVVGFVAGRLARKLTRPRRGLGALPLTLERRERFHDATLH